MVKFSPPAWLKLPIFIDNTTIILAADDALCLTLSRSVQFSSHFSTALVSLFVVRVYRAIADINILSSSYR